MDTLKIRLLEDMQPFVTVYNDSLVKVPELKKDCVIELPKRTALVFIIKHKAKRVN